jgi:cation diffusion facilitator family transporter
MSTEGGTKAVIAALLANSGIAVSKFVAFAITGSTSMLSEAIHSVADALNQVLLLIGGKRSKRVADDKYQFGYGRVRYIYGFMVAIVLFMVGGIYSLYEGWHKWNHPEPVSNHWIAIGVLTIAIILESFSLRTAVQETNKVRGKRSFAKFVRDARQPELPVILLEDFGALLGLVFAMFGVSFAVITGDGRWDGMGAMAIGTLLIIIAIILIREMSAMLIGEGALPEEYDAVKAALESAPLVERVIHLRTLHVGPDALLVGAKIAIKHQDSARQIAQGIDEAERLLRLAVPSAQYVFLEPDLDRTSAPS